MKKFMDIKPEKGSLSHVPAIGAHVFVYSTLSTPFLGGQASSSLGTSARSSMEYQF